MKVFSPSRLQISNLEARNEFWMRGPRRVLDKEVLNEMKPRFASDVKNVKVFSP
jgi:hypothetical protein